MKIFIFLTAFIGFGIIAKAQDKLPSYPDVVSNFFNRYAEPADEQQVINFAKRKDGWYVQLVYPWKNDSVILEQPFWTLINDHYSYPEAGFTLKEDDEKSEKSIWKYLSGEGAGISWYQYERCRYVGYAGWEDDMINDFGAKALLPDTLLEGLARAYSDKSHRYFWYQTGGQPNGSDPLQSRIARTELPSKERLEKAAFYIHKAIETNLRLLKQNPAYKVRIGGIGLKASNEAMFGYMQMKMAGQDQMAQEFLDAVPLEEHYIQQAKNYLNSCDKNAILFTYGDNDTYQLLYVQGKLNYRRDITVINSSLLGLAAYLQQLKNTRAVNFSGAISFYADGAADVSYYQAAKQKLTGLKTADQLLAWIYSGKHKLDYDAGEAPPYNTYPVQTIALTVDPSRFNKITQYKTTAQTINILLKNYLVMNDLAMIDIINANINSRPVYFTSSYTGYFEKNLLSQGIVYRLFPFDNNRKATEANAKKALAIYATTIHKPVVNFEINGVKQLSYDGNTTFCELYENLTSDPGRTGDAARKKWFDVIKPVTTGFSEQNMPGTFYLAMHFREEKAFLKEQAKTYARSLCNRVMKPSALAGYLSRKDCIDALHNLEDTLGSLEIENNFISDLLIELATH